MPRTEIGYVEAIERHLGAHRGREHVLSPRDFALARSWHRTGVPLATVLAGMDDAFGSGSAVSSLAFCQRRVEALIAAGAGEATPAASTAGPLRDVAVQGVNRLFERLTALEPGAPAAFESVVARIQAFRDHQPSPQGSGEEDLGRWLGEIDTLVAAAALQALPVEVAAALQAEATRALERQRGRVGEGALAEALQRFRAQKAREFFGLPLVSSFREALEPGGTLEPGRDGGA